MGAKEKATETPDEIWQVQRTGELQALGGKEERLEHSARQAGKNLMAGQAGLLTT